MNLICQLSDHDNSLVLLGEGNPFWSAVSSFMLLEEIEEGHDRGFSGIGGESGYNESDEAIGRRVGDASYDSESQFVQMSELWPMVVTSEGV